MSAGPDERACGPQIDRTADDKDARVIFRTAGADSPLPKKLPRVAARTVALSAKESRALHARDRSSIYGGFHVYVRRPFPRDGAAEATRRAATHFG